MAKRKGKHKLARPFNSTLPVWIVESSKIKGTVIAECPRCGGRAILNLKRWRDGTNKEFMGRSCPYCFSTSRLPVRYMNEKLLELLERNPDEIENKNGEVFE